jgi:hypothetical protein
VFERRGVYWVVRLVFERRGHLKTGEENGLAPASSPSRALTDVQCCLC